MGLTTAKSSIDKSLSQNCHRVLSPTHKCTLKEESKVANRDWVDHQACSLLQYINVIANILVMRNYFNKLRWKIIRVNNLLQLIHLVTIELRLRKSLLLERFMSNMEFRYQIIVLVIKVRKGFTKFMILNFSYLCGYKSLSLIHHSILIWFNCFTDDTFNTVNYLCLAGIFIWHYWPYEQKIAKM